MTTTEDIPTYRPFHVTIIDMINNAVDMMELMKYGWLIKMTSIPKGHDEIAEAWKKKRTQLTSLNNDFGVLESLAHQKQLAEKKALEKTKKVVDPSGEVSREIGRAFALLTSTQRDEKWDLLFRESLTELAIIVPQALRR